MTAERILNIIKELITIRLEKFIVKDLKSVSLNAAVSERLETEGLDTHMRKVCI